MSRISQNVQSWRQYLLCNATVILDGSELPPGDVLLEISGPTPDRLGEWKGKFSTVTKGRPSFPKNATLNGFFISIARMKAEKIPVGYFVTEIDDADSLFESDYEFNGIGEPPRETMPPAPDESPQ